MLVEGMCALAVVAWWRSGKQEKTQGMTPERQACYDAALRRLKDPKQLYAMADLFDRFGCPAEAMVFRIRAKGKEIPLEEKEKRKDAFRRAMSSTNPDAVEAIAEVFYTKYGAIGAADAMRNYAKGLRRAGAIPANIQPTNVPAPPEPSEPSKAEPEPESPTPVDAEARHDNGIHKVESSDVPSLLTVIPEVKAEVLDSEGRILQ